MNKEEERYIKIIPSDRQVAIQQMEFYGFIHFTVNTFTGKEWGDGTESPLVFNPTKLDATQWTKAASMAGMKGLILTCKHHDGFCLWPSNYTKHTISESPYKNGKGDIVKELAEACHLEGIKFGVYLSPWDRNQPSYGFGKEYDDYFINQLTELLTGYGDIFTVWLDGACGEGCNGKKQRYDWERYYEVIRRLQPNACINVCGPDVRWCGNEAGKTRPSEWSVVPRRLSDKEKIIENSQQQDDESFREKTIQNTDLDLGSRQVIKEEKDLIWYPSEVDVSIRPGWFYHEEEDLQVKTLEALMDIYIRSVGGNASLLLNLPPTKEGLIHDNDVQRLKELGEGISNIFKDNLVKYGEFSVDSFEQGYGIESVREDNYDSYFKTEDGIVKATISVDLQEEKKISYVVLKENIKRSQRMEAFELEALVEGEYHMLYQGTTVGYKKIIQLNPIITKSIRIRILDARICPTISFIGIY